jgi:hypothetical protein
LDEVTVKDMLEGDNMYTCSKCQKKVRAEKRYTWCYFILVAETGIAFVEKTVDTKIYLLKFSSA